MGIGSRIERANPGGVTRSIDPAFLDPRQLAIETKPQPYLPRYRPHLLRTACRASRKQSRPSCSAITTAGRGMSTVVVDLSTVVIPVRLIYLPARDQPPRNLGVAECGHSNRRDYYAYLNLVTEIQTR